MDRSLNRSVPQLALWALALLALLPLGAANAHHRPAAAFPGYTKFIIDPHPGKVTYSKVLADLNGDGKLDIVIGTDSGMFWWAFPASGKISDPWPKSTIHSSGSYYEDCQVYDLNGDGRVDIIACRDNTMYWYENPGGNATGAWIEHYIGGGLGHNVELADIDGDGKIDVVTQYGIYFQNNPDDWTYVGLGSMKGLALLDIGSGLGAVNVVLNTANGVTWYENPREWGGNARTNTWFAHLIDGSVAADEMPLAGGKISNDGKWHILGNPTGSTNNQFVGQLVWWEAPNDRRSGAWAKHVIGSSSGLGDYQNIHKIAVADMDGNGTLDLVVGEQEQSHDPASGPYTFNNDRVTVFFNDGAGNFAEDILETTGGHNDAVGNVLGTASGFLDFFNVNHGYYGAPSPIELFMSNQNLSTPPPPPPPPPPPGNGSLSGSSASASPSGYDLTALGTADWAHWGRGAVYGNFDHKATGGGQISNVTTMGSGAINVGGWSYSPRTVTWSDGTPTSGGTDDGYIWSNGDLGTGFTFTVPAGKASRTLLIFYGASDATATLSAHLSDGSAADYSNSRTGPGAWLETLTYQASSDGQTLAITLLKTGNNSGFTNGSADLVAAMLEDGSSSPPPPPPPPPPPGSGSLSGSSAGASPSGYNLTALGVFDWAHWGRGATYGNFDDKASGGGQITNVAVVGSGTVNVGGWSDPSRTVTWSDGTPTPSGTDDGYIWSNGDLGTGFTFTVPADTTPRTLFIFYGASDATATLSAHLSDGSAADYSNSRTGPGAWLETLTYQAASASQTLTITLLKTGNNAGFTNGSADLVAAMLQDPPPAGAPAGGGASQASSSGGSGGGGCGATGLEFLIVLGLLCVRRRPAG